MKTEDYRGPVPPCVLSFDDDRLDNDLEIKVWLIEVNRILNARLIQDRGEYKMEYCDVCGTTLGVDSVLAGLSVCVECIDLIDVDNEMFGDESYLSDELIDRMNDDDDV